MTEHRLKTWPIFFEAVERGDKTFEVRKNDRSFQRGDTLVLERYHPEFGYEKFGGNAAPTLKRSVTYVLAGGMFGVEPGYAVLGLGSIGDDK